MRPSPRAEKVDLAGDEAHLLQIAAAVPGKRSDEASPDILKNKQFLEKSRHYWVPPHLTVVTSSRP
jgi:hypothetical protein